MTEPHVSYASFTARFIDDEQALREAMGDVIYAALASRCGYPLLYVGDGLLQSPGDELGIGDLERCCYPLLLLWASSTEMVE